MQQDVRNSETRAAAAGPHPATDGGPDAVSPRTRPLQVLVPGSLVQFIDLSIPDPAIAGVAERFFEELGSDDGAPSLHLVALEESGIFQHPTTGAVEDPARTFVVTGSDALEAFAGVWLPLPIMRIVPGLPADECEEGPSNWARVMIVPRVASGDAGARRVVLAIDTMLSNGGQPNARELGPTLEDCQSGRNFRFSADLASIAWFVTEPWVDEWVAEAHRECRSAVAPETVPPARARLEHLAVYLTLLVALREADVVPDIQFLDPAAAAVDKTGRVDLIVDLGSSRTAAMLRFATDFSGSPRAAHSIIPLPIRDLSQPWVVHSGLFPSRVEFARPSLGKEVYSRWSGRAAAFAWPSLARIGCEARRIAAEQSATDATTGVASPISYLWDDSPARVLWRFAGQPAGAPRRNPVISGTVLSGLTDTGDVATDLDGDQQSAVKPRFSRSSLLTFFAAELLQHAIAASNAPQLAVLSGGLPAIRRLERLIVTLPASFGPEEQAIAKARLEAAVRLVWRSHGWQASQGGAPPPTVEMGIDVGTASQLAFIEDEVTQKLGGDPGRYIAMMARGRSGQGQRTLRIATLDIGGGSASLTINRVVMADADDVTFVPLLREGFRIGGDDIARRLAEAVILPAIRQRMGECRLPDARVFLRNLLAGEGAGLAVRGVELRRRLAGEILFPAAVALLDDTEAARTTRDESPVQRPIGELLGTASPGAASVAYELAALAADHGADGFDILACPLSVTRLEVAALVRKALDPVLGSALRAIAALDCDLVLLSGWITRLPPVREAMLEALSTRPDRILALHEHRLAAVGVQGGRAGLSGDTKLMTVVGAAIASAAVPRLAGRLLKFSPATLDERAGFIGIVGADGLISADQVLHTISGEGGSSEAGSKGASMRSTISIIPPVTIGYRRAPLPSWPALPLMTIELGEMEADSRPRPPLRVQLEWPRIGGQRLPWVARVTDADGIELADGEIVLRLKTLGGGHSTWLDSGELTVE